MMATFAVPCIDLGQLKHANSAIAIAAITLPGYSE
jgi:hypothetical protein